MYCVILYNDRMNLVISPLMRCFPHYELLVLKLHNPMCSVCYLLAAYVGDDGLVLIVRGCPIANYGRCSYCSSGEDLHLYMDSIEQQDDVWILTASTNSKFSF